MNRPEAAIRIKERELIIQELKSIKPRSASELGIVTDQIVTHQNAIRSYKKSIGRGKLPITESDEKKKQKIIELVTEHTGITMEQILKKDRHFDVVFARHLICYLMKEKTRYSLINIGRVVGGKDHTTVLHSCRKIHDLMETDKIAKEEIEYLWSLI